MDVRTQVRRTGSPVPGVSGTRCRGPTWRSWKAVLTSWQLYASTSITVTANMTADKIQKELQEFTRGHIPRDIAASHSRYPCGGQTAVALLQNCDRTESRRHWRSDDEIKHYKCSHYWLGWEWAEVGAEGEPVCPAFSTLHWSVVCMPVPKALRTLPSLSAHFSYVPRLKLTARRYLYRDQQLLLNNV